MGGMEVEMKNINYVNTTLKRGVCDGRGKKNICGEEKGL